MARVGDNYLELVDKFIFMGGEIRHMNMTEEQKLRTMISYEAYQVWMSNKQIKAMDLCRRISSRIYSDMLERSHHDEYYAELCERLNVRPGKQREYSKLSNDVATFDHLVGRFNTPTINIEKAKVIDASDWLLTEGMKNGNERSVTSGAKLKMDLFKGFDERQQGFEDIAETDINITGDVSVVKPDRENYSEEYLKKLADQYGISQREVEDLMLNDKGEYETAPKSVEREKDIYERSEEEV